MLWLNPNNVTLGTLTLGNVSAILVSRTGDRTVLEYDDAGKFPTFADVPEQRCDIILRRTLTADEPPPAALGDALTLAFIAAPGASGAQRRSVSITLVITAIEHTLNPRTGAEQIIRAVGTSTNGTIDPITLTALET